MSITALEIVGKIADTTTAGLSARDVLPIVSPTGRAKIMQSFDKTPFEFRFIVCDLPAFGVTRTTQSGAAYRKRVISDNIQRQKDEAPNSIQIIYGNNITSEANYMPFTAWILAHRIGHMNLLYYEGSNQSSGQVCPNDQVFNAAQKTIMSHCPPLYSAAYGNHSHWPAYTNDELNEFVGGNCMTHDIWRLLVMPLINTRCARRCELATEVDVFAELVAQYVITGRINLTPANELRERVTTYDRIVPGFSRKKGTQFWLCTLDNYDLTVIQTMLDELTIKLNREIHAWLATLVGKTWAF